MAEDEILNLMNARAALERKRLSLARTIAGADEAPEGAIKAIVEVQQAIEVIDIAIEEAEELEDLEEAAAEDDEEE